MVRGRTKRTTDNTEYEVLVVYLGDKQTRFPLAIEVTENVDIVDGGEWTADCEP